MKPGNVFISIDLGAGSGRVMAASSDLVTLQLEEIHRFDNPGTELPGGCYWNILGLYHEILVGLRRSVERYGPDIVSIGIDTWGCDFGLIDANGELLGLPHQYRDPRSDGVAETMHAILPETEIFARTGLKTSFYNTSLHLLAETRRKASSLLHAERLLFLPDLLAYWLTGKQVVERTIASTSQLIDPVTGDWARDVITSLGLPGKLFGEIVAPGTIIGPLRSEVASLIGQGNIPFIASASHDTAAAVAGMPLNQDENLWLSSGTWSIMGVETDKPITTPDALRHGFCNELGVDGTVCFLKSIAGLWLIQECKRQWGIDGIKLGYPELTSLANAAEPFAAFIDPDDPCFATPGNMPDKIREWCSESGQQVPEGHGDVLRVITESLALKYRVVLDSIRAFTGRSFSRLHAGGGGIQNEFLCQATANALGIEVVAGPVEASSCGNVITQMIATGHLPDTAAGREIIQRSFSSRTYAPDHTPAWEEALVRFRRVLDLEPPPELKLAVGQAAAQPMRVGCAVEI